jgi:putative sterol carrier protein
MNPGVTAVMKLVQLGIRLADSEAQRAERRGISGVLNLEFTGEDGGGWRVAFGEGRVSVAPGLAAEPRATMRMAPEVFLALVAGDQSVSVARMTGRVRLAGDGNFGPVFSAFVGGLQNAQRLPGFRGWMTRRLVRRALRKGGYQPRPRGTPGQPPRPAAHSPRGEPPS